MKIRYLDPAKTWQEQWFSSKRPGKSVCVVRYGAFGDMIQTSSILPGLKEQGYHVTLNATPRGFDVVRADPHIDEVFLQEPDQVPNPELGEYWKQLGKGFDKFVNLCESVEGSLLALPGRRSWNWNKDFRDLVMSVDYIDGQHAIAGVPGPQRPKFFPSLAETEAAGKFHNKISGKKSFVIMWALSGSSIHKAWPYTDQIVARLMLTDKRIKIVFVGDKLCQLLESGWAKEPRVIRKSGKWSIRETLSYLPFCDMVVGPETGVLNAAAYESPRKILFMSHSNPKNLGGNWPNTVTMEPDGCPCYPCHQLHYQGQGTCQRDTETGGSLCAARISADRVYSEILGAFHELS